MAIYNKWLTFKPVWLSGDRQVLRSASLVAVASRSAIAWRMEPTVCLPFGQRTNGLGRDAFFA